MMKFLFTKMLSLYYARARFSRQLSVVYIAFVFYQKKCLDNTATKSFLVH